MGTAAFVQKADGTDGKYQRPLQKHEQKALYSAKPSILLEAKGMTDTGLDLISETFSLNNYLNVTSRIAAIQERYIESRIKWFWRLPLIRQFTATKVILMFTAPGIDISGVEDEKFTVAFSQRVMLVGRTEFWAHLLMKRRK